MKRLLIAAILAVGPLAHAKLSTDLSAEDKLINRLETIEYRNSGNASLLLDTETDEVCVVSSSNYHLNIPKCGIEELAMAQEIDNLPKNPKLAFAPLIIQGLIQYYSICSAVHFSPDIADFTVDKLNEHKNFSSRVSDHFDSQSGYRKTKELINEVRDYTDLVSGTICLPVTATNKVLLDIVKN